MNNSEVEIWKSIQNYPDYEVSNLGRVRSYKRSLFEPHILARKLCKTGYYAVGLSKPGSKTNWANIHRLVAFAFVEGYFEGADVCHKNNIRTDSRACNLRWGTRSSNIMDKHEHGTMPLGEKHHNSKLTQESVEFVRSNPSISLAELGRKFGVTRQTIWFVRHNKMWKKREVCNA